jgi:cell division protease FtsH
MFIFLVPWLSNYFSENTGTEISFSEFQRQLTAGNIEKVILQGERISGTYKKAAEAKNPEGTSFSYKDFFTYLPPVAVDNLIPMLETQKVEITTKPTNGTNLFKMILTNFFPFLILILIGLALFRQRSAFGQNMFSFGGSRARLYERRKESTTFKDVAGAQGAKTELQEIVEFLKDPARIQRLGGKAPKGVLLLGPPGTGKTMLARAVAGEAEVPFLSITGSDFMEMFVGVGASRVRNMFNEAKKMAPAIIFIDEIDSIGRKRGAGIGGGQDEREQTLNQLLSELDGFEANEHVVVMAATNRPDILDTALLRPGRFDRRITIDLPNLMSRVEILKIHARNKIFSSDLDFEEIARGTPGFSGADLENLLNEAAILASRLNKDKIEKKDIDAAMDKIIMGLERENMVITSEERKTLAYHEGGHAVVAAVLPETDPIHKVTIVPRGQAMGVTQQLPEREKYIYSKEYLLARFAVMMGGRAGEELAIGTSTSGAAEDLKQATALVHRMIMELGMSQSLGQMALTDSRENVFLGQELGQRRSYSEETAREIDRETKQILQEAYDRATDILRSNREGLDRIAAKLLEKEEITGKEVLDLLGINKQNRLGNPLSGSDAPRTECKEKSKDLES